MDELNRSRLEEFRQLRQEVRHSGEYSIVGIDIAKGQHHAFLKGTATIYRKGFGVKAKLYILQQKK